ncbi:hypothetical protein XANCAGTX0491_007328 [Xanthoria calcicola]
MTHPKRKRQTTPPSHAVPTQASKAKRVRFSLQGPLSCRPIDRPAEAPNEITGEGMAQASVKKEEGEDGASDGRVDVQPNDEVGGNEEPTPERAPVESTTGVINDGPKVEPDLNDVRVDAAAFDHYPLGVDSSSDSDSESDSSDTEDSLDGDSLDDDSLDDSSEDSSSDDSLNNNSSPPTHPHPQHLHLPNPHKPKPSPQRPSHPLHHHKLQHRHRDTDRLPPDELQHATLHGGRLPPDELQPGRLLDRWLCRGLQQREGRERGGRVFFHDE